MAPLVTKEKEKEQDKSEKSFENEKMEGKPQFEKSRTLDKPIDKGMETGDEDDTILFSKQSLEQQQKHHAMDAREEQDKI